MGREVCRGARRLKSLIENARDERMGRGGEGREDGNRRLKTQGRRGPSDGGVGGRRDLNRRLKMQRRRRRREKSGQGKGD